MTQTGDDCYFFYYSKCSKGALCPFRHQETALGSETMCSLWKEGRCFRPACSFRHMDIQKNRSHIPCYWEKQPGGCQKPHCVFLHTAASRIVPAVEVKKESILPIADQLDRTTLKTTHPPPATISAQQRLGQELCCNAKDVPSPKVEQLVINPFEEESDQESINGTPQKLPKPENHLGSIVGRQKGITSPKVVALKEIIEEEEIIVPMTSTFSEDLVANSDDGIPKKQEEQNLGIKTLEEIQREKALQSLFRNRSLMKASGQSVSSEQQAVEVPLKRRIVLASGEGSSVFPVNDSKVQNSVEKKKTKSEIGKSSRSIRVVSPVRVARTSRNIKDRLDLKAANTENRVEDSDKRSPDPDDCQRKAAFSSRKRRDLDSEFSRSRLVTEKISKKDGLLKNVNTSKEVNPTQSKGSRTEEVNVVIKSLDEIKTEKRAQRRRLEQTEETKTSDAKKLVRRARPSMEIYQPPVHSRIGISNNSPNKKIANENTSEENNTVVKLKSTEVEKSDAWLHVKSFAEIMKEKREKQLKDAESGSSESIRGKKTDANGDKSVSKVSESQRYNSGELKNGGGSVCHLDILKSRNDGSFKKPDDTNSSRGTNEISKSEITANNCKRKFVPIVFDLEDKSESSENKSRKTISEPVFKQKKLSSSQVSNSHLHSEALGQNLEKSASKTLNLGSGALDGSLKKIGSAAKGSVSSSSSFVTVKKSATADKSESIVVDSTSVDSDLIRSSLPATNAAPLKNRRLSQKLLGGMSEFKAKIASKDMKNEESLKLEDEDDFTKQLDDLMVDISCISDEFPELKDKSQDDDELLLEIQELLS